MRTPIFRWQMMALALLVAPDTHAAESPCSGDAYRAFDFWAGQWEVFLADGRKAGENRISIRDGGCLLLEQWQGSGGSTGTSMNFYDPLSEQWVQVWMGSGVLIRIHGGPGANGMRLEGEITDLASREKRPFRGLWTLLDDGRVRQFFEQSDDDGKTWKTWFEGFYVRKTDRGTSR